MMKHSNLLDMSDAPVFCHNVPDYRAEAFEQAKQNAKLFGFAHILYNGLYYQVTSSDFSVKMWKRKGYKLIHTEESDAVKRSHNNA